MFWERTLVQLVWVSGWPFWWQLGLWVRGWESSMSTLWTDHFTPRIFVLLAFPSPSILAAPPPPSTPSGSILHLFLKYLDSQFLFHSTHHECFDYWRVILIYNSVTWVCVCGGEGASKIIAMKGRPWTNITPFQKYYWGLLSIHEGILFQSILRVLILTTFS